jgi:pyridoxal phosphate-dependent aminotransferase EpsN
MARVYLSPPDVGERERDFVLAAIDSNWVAPIGPDLDAFEADLAYWSGRRHAVGLSSGTAALHLCLHALGVGRGDRVLVSSFTFAATANAVVYTGADPVFIDSEAESWNISPELLERVLREGRQTGRMPKALIAVDLYGQCANYAEIERLCDEYGVVLIEDAAESLGGWAFGRRAGSFGRVSVFSFNGNKIITTSGGGAVVTDDEKLAGRIRHLSTQAREPAAHYEHTELGFNYRLSNILAAFGRGQLSNLDDRIGRRKATRERYENAFADCPLTFMPVPEWSRPNHWLTTIVLDRATDVTNEDIRLALEADNIESRPLWKPMHRQPFYASAESFIDGTSDDLFAHGLCLPSGSSLGPHDQDRTSAIVTNLFGTAKQAEG